MGKHKLISALILGLSLCFGMTALGSILGYSAIRHREFERTVTVKGLSEREYSADTAIWTIEFTQASDSLSRLREEMATTTDTIRSYLLVAGLGATEISVTAPVVNDSYTNQYRDTDSNALRYTATRSLTVYTNSVGLLRTIIADFSTADDSASLQLEGSWRTWARYEFESLNAVKPDMIEEATRNARQVAIKFAADSGSRLGRIKYASQGQFSIRERDGTNPHIKRVRVVSTIEYYLAD